MGHSSREISRNEHDLEVVLAVVKEMLCARDNGGGRDDDCSDAKQRNQDAEWRSQRFSLPRTPLSDGGLKKLS